MNKVSKLQKYIFAPIVAAFLLAGFLGLPISAFAEETEEMPTPAVAEDAQEDSGSEDGILLASTSSDTSSVTGVTLGEGFTVYTTQTVDQVSVYEQALTRVKYWRQDALNDTSVKVNGLTMKEYLANISMSENDYLNPQWSNALERIAVQRAVEAYSYAQGHTRPNATLCFAAKYNGISASGEIIAWGGNITRAIDAWAAEKSDYVNNTGEETGHYLQLIMPSYKYYGFGVCGSACTGETRGSLSNTDNTTSFGLKGTYTFEVAVSDLHVNEGVTWSGQDTVAPGTSETYALKLVYASAARSYFIKGTWSSSNTNVATIDQNGVLTAKSNGSTTITLTSEGKSWSKDIIVSRIDVSKTSVSLDSSTFTYSGAAQTPGVTVTYGSKTLVQNTDYKVSYSNNTNAGTATVTITGLGNYTGTTAQQFTIDPFKISYRNSTVTLNPSSYTYTGNPIKPEPVVKNGDKTLVKDKDYTLTYEDNVEAAGYSAAVIVTGAGNYTGYMYKYFTISRASISSAAVTLSQSSYTYTGSAITPNVTVKLNGKTLRKDTDYTLRYSSNTSVGTAYVYVYGAGNYGGYTYKTFTIKSSSTSPTSPTNPSTPTKPATSASTQTMYRLYNPFTGEHLYTASTKERDTLSKIGWHYEGVGWTAPSTSNTPVYRLYNPYAPGGDHHYTTNEKEYNSLQKVGWKGEGIAWYSDDTQGVPLYRQYNPYAQTGTHNYTANKKENDALVKLGWKAEGIGWYGVK